MRAKDARVTVAELHEKVRPLLGITRSDIGVVGDGMSLLPELATVDAIIATLQETRLELLRHERRIGTSWREISDQTGVNPNTWRYRHNRGVTGA